MVISGYKCTGFKAYKEYEGLRATTQISPLFKYNFFLYNCVQKRVKSDYCLRRYKVNITGDISDLSFSGQKLDKSGFIWFLHQSSHTVYIILFVDNSTDNLKFHVILDNILPPVSLITFLATITIYKLYNIII